MPALADATLTDAERRTLEPLVPLLEEEFGDALHGRGRHAERRSCGSQ